MRIHIIMDDNMIEEVEEYAEKKNKTELSHVVISRQYNRVMITS